MSKVPLCDSKGARIGDIEVSDAFFKTRGGRGALYEVVTAYLANQRAGTASTKKRGEVSGGGAKPWRQKGTGRARAGSNRSPIWRGGGIVFGPKPRDYSVKVPSAKRRLALQRALGEKVAGGQVLIVDKFEITEPRTRQVAALLRALKADKGALLVDGEVARPLALAARNIEGVEALKADSVCAYHLLRYPLAVFSKSGWERMRQRVEGGDRRSS
jgi:large subunit ribosomal protein L4